MITTSLVIYLPKSIFHNMTFSTECQNEPRWKPRFDPKMRSPERHQQMADWGFTAVRLGLNTERRSMPMMEITRIMMLHWCCPTLNICLYKCHTKNTFPPNWQPKANSEAWTVYDPQLTIMMMSMVSRCNVDMFNMMMSNMMVDVIHSKNESPGSPDSADNL